MSTFSLNIAMIKFNAKVTAYYVHMKTMLGGQQLADRFEVQTHTHQMFI